MRHAGSLVAAMEGISRPAFRIARELVNNSRAGLTVRFLSKKLDISEEEVEYLVEINHRFLYTDLTRIKIVAEGMNTVKRISAGLENHGDIPSMFRYMKTLTPHEFRQLEEWVEIDEPCAKKTVIEELINRYYVHPDSAVDYVATRGFSPVARELFDIVWQSKEGLLPIAKIRALYGGSEFESERGLAELFRGLALFELFRFDAEERLVRAAGLLSEIRQWREASAKEHDQTTLLKPHRGLTSGVVSHGVAFSDTICRLVAAIAAKPVRLRGDGDLFLEDRRRLGEICAEDAEPSLQTCLWAAEGVGWLARVDNELRAGELEPLVQLDRIRRHRLLVDWLLAGEKESHSRRILGGMIEEVRPGTWYPTTDTIHYAMVARGEEEPPVLRSSGAHWNYVSPTAAAHSELSLVRSLEETFLWLGIVDHGEDGRTSLFRVSELGEHVLTGKAFPDSAIKFPARKAEIIVQPNFDVVVPTQDMDPLLTVPLDQFAERGSTGKATVYHLAKEAFTRAIQEGHDATGFVNFLLAHVRGGALPANVMTTLEDWRGGLKRVRLRTLQVLETDDPLILADLLHRRRFRKVMAPLDPHKVAVYAGIAKNDLAKELEKDGFLVE